MRPASASWIGTIDEATVVFSWEPAVAPRAGLEVE
jgi:hypothetical protein